MPFGFDPSRLLKVSWDSPSDLARGLYEMLTTPGKKVVDQPVEIRPQHGQQGLVVAGAKQETPQELAQLQTIRESRRQADAVADNRRPEQQQWSDVKTLVQDGKPGLAAVDGLKTASILSDLFTKPAEVLAEKVFGHAVAEVAQQTTSKAITASLAPAPPPILPVTKPTEILTGRSPVPPSVPPMPVSSVDKQPSRSGTLVRPIATTARMIEPPGGLTITRQHPTPQPGSAPYSRPVFEVSGQAAFTGGKPVQFDVAPEVWNPRTVQFERIGSSFTVPPWDGSNLRLAQVTGDITPATYQIQSPSQPPVPGNGTIQTFAWDPDQTALFASDQGNDTPCFNLYPLPALEGTWIWVFTWMGSYWIASGQALTALAYTASDITANDPGAGPVMIVGFDGNALYSTSYTVPAYTLSSQDTKAGSYLGLIAIGAVPWIMWEGC